MNYIVQKSYVSASAQLLKENPHPDQDLIAIHFLIKTINTVLCYHN